MQKPATFIIPECVGIVTGQTTDMYDPESVYDPVAASFGIITDRWALTAILVVGAKSAIRFLIKHP